MRSLCSLTALLVALPAMADEEKAQDMAEAMEIPELDLYGADVTGADDAAAIITALGIVSSTAPPDMAAIGSGKVGAANTDPGTDLVPGGVSGDNTVFTVTLKVPPLMNSMGFDMDFFSAEYPVYVGSAYNDTFTAYVSGDAWTGNVAVDSTGSVISVNNVLFAVTNAAALQGTGYGGHGSTGWLTAVAPVEPETTVVIEFSCQDLGDGILDSTALLDNFFWSEEDVEEPGILEPPRLHYMEPKRGHITGGVPSILHGEVFHDFCVPYINGVQVQGQFLDEERFRIIPPASGVPGLVDVDLDCGHNRRTRLFGGYTYYIEEDGELPPVIDRVLPYEIPLEGGIEVTVDGVGFDEGTVLRVDGDILEHTLVDSTRITFVAPEREAPGYADVEIVAATGLSDERMGAMMYVFRPEWPPVDDPADPDNLGDPGCSCDHQGSVGWSALALAPLLLLRRRRS